MASDNHANYFRVGFTVILGVAAIVAVLVYLGGFGDRRDEVLAETCYDKPVTGLSVGSAVNFRGVKVGEVRRISFIGSEYDVDGADNQRIYILMALGREQMGLAPGTSAEELLRRLVREKGLRVTVSSSGITGLSRLEMDCYPNAPAPEAVAWRPECLFIPPRLSLIDNFSDAATRLMNQLNRMDFKSAWSNVAAVADSWAKITTDLQALLESRIPSFDRAMENLDRATGLLSDFAEKVRDNPSLLLRPNDPEPLPETSR